MSGTSLDGLDLALCHIWNKEGKWKFEIKDTQSISYNQELRNNLRDAIHLSAVDHIFLHNSYGQWLGEQARNFIGSEKLEVDFIASHGHTSHHQPERGITWQLGSGQHLAYAAGMPVISDFRTADLALGGQGAPLVPIGDQLFFSEYSYCLNLGGISNISLEENGKRIAYDIGLANMLLNHITRKIDMDYDPDGKMARSGKVVPDLLEQLNALEYYKLPFPKSTGYEWFLESVAPLVDASTANTADLLHTGVHHICQQVGNQVASHGKKGNLLVCGGGALNGFMMDTLKQHMPAGVNLDIPDPVLIAFKEALVFALMGVLRKEGKHNVLSSVTGACRDSVSGTIYLP